MKATRSSAISVVVDDASHWMPIRSSDRDRRVQASPSLLTATDDDVMDDERVVVIASVRRNLQRRMQIDVAVTDTTGTEAAPEPVPALPLIAQWLLGLGLMGGGARQLFRRRNQSQG